MVVTMALAWAHASHGGQPGHNLSQSLTTLIDGENNTRAIHRWTQHYVSWFLGNFYVGTSVYLMWQ